jgi:hypothetical protein
MPNTLVSLLEQGNVNWGINAASAYSVANSGGNFVAGLVAINALNPATSAAAAVNAAPVHQTNFALDPDAILDPDGIDFL